MLLATSNQTELFQHLLVKQRRNLFTYYDIGFGKDVLLYNGSRMQKGRRRSPQRRSRYLDLTCPRGSRHCCRGQQGKAPWPR